MGILGKRGVILISPDWKDIKLERMIKMLYFINKVKNEFEDSLNRYFVSMDVENELYLTELFELGIF